MANAPIRLPFSPSHHSESSIRSLPKISLIECGCTAAERASKQASEQTSVKHALQFNWNPIDNILAYYVIVFDYSLIPFAAHTHTLTHIHIQTEWTYICCCISTHRLLSLTLSFFIQCFSIVPVDWITVCVNSQCVAAVIILDFSIYSKMLCQNPANLPTSLLNMWMPFDGRHSQCVH